MKVLAAFLAALSFAASCNHTAEVEEVKDYPVLEKDAPGVYGYNGETWTYDEDSDQISRLYKDGKVTFSILTPGTGGYVSVSGIPEKPDVSEIFSVTLKDNRNSSLGTAALSVTVLKVEDGMVWMTTKDKVGIIAKF